MKKELRFIFFPALIIFLLMHAQLAIAADPPPPPPPGSHGAQGNQGPMGAPVSSGVVLFITFAAAMAGWEIFLSRKRKQAEMQN
jgi:hypothetical protein